MNVTKGVQTTHKTESKRMAAGEVDSKVLPCTFYFEQFMYILFEFSVVFFNEICMLSTSILFLIHKSSLKIKFWLNQK